MATWQISKLRFVGFKTNLFSIYNWLLLYNLKKIGSNWMKYKINTLKFKMMKTCEILKKKQDLK